LQRLHLFAGSAERSVARLYRTGVPWLVGGVIPGAVPLILATLAAAGTGVEVRSTSDCPSAQGISERLLPLLPAAPSAAGSNDLAEVKVLEARADGTTDLSLRLLRPDASEIGDRRISLSGSCAEMAEAAAAILAAWETDFRSEGAADEEPVAPAVKDAAPAVAVTSAPNPRWNILVGAGAGAALVGGVAAAGTVEALLGKAASHWQLRISAATQTARSLDLSSGHADWQHTTFAAGLLCRSLGPAWRLSLDVGPVLGWAGLAGNGLSPNREQRVFEYGGAAGLRVGRTWGRWTVWAEGRADLWLHGEQATAKDAVSGQVLFSADVPSVDAIASLGLSVALFQ